LLEIRKIKRSLRYLNVKEPATGKLISYTGNVHHKGLMLVGESGIKLHRDTPILLEIPGEEGIKTRIPLVINGIWAQTDEDPVFNKTGCQIVNASPRAIRKLKQLFPANLDGEINKYKISYKILNTTCCTKDFSCLAKKEYISKFRCEADYIDNNNVVYLKPRVSKEILQQCHYAFTHTSGKIICRCPVRYHLCKEYGV
jgi:hypothetical protein